MKKLRPWVEALGISEQDYQGWSAHVPATESVTFHCLRAGRIPVEAYLEWACNFYELPVLTSAFFAHTPNHELFEKLKNMGTWSHEIMPVGEWEGVIYVACTEPNEDISWSFNVCYVLAPPASLESHWKTLNNVRPAETPAPPVIDEITKTAFPQLPNIPTPEAAPPEMAPPPVAEVKKDDPFAAIEMQLSKATPAETKVESAEAPAGLNISEAPSGLAPEGLNLPDLPENTMTSILVKADETEAPSHSPSQDLTAMQSIAQDHFKELKNDFIGCMLLSFDSENLKPLAWDEKWKTTGPNTAFISLSNASAFRVVFRTKMPYLGHVVETPSNKEFFSAWGFSVLPESILVQPLIENGQWYGMLLLLADKTKKQSVLLTVAEQLAARLANVMAKAGMKAAA